MLVISAGMQRAASASYFNLTNDLLVASGKLDAREARRRFRFTFFSTQVNVNVGPLRVYKLIWLLAPHLLGHTFAVKTHEAPSGGAQLAVRLGVACASYIYRDPRDVALSLYRYGSRMRSQGIETSTQFDKLTSLDMAMHFVADRLPVWRAWTSLESVHVVQFEQFKRDTLAAANRLAEFLDLELPRDTILQLGRRYEPARVVDNQPADRVHFSGGEVGGWRQVFSPDQIALSERLFSPFLREMGYEAR